MSAVIYVHNAGKRIGDFLNMVIRVLEDNFDHSEIVCVNDGSDDSSIEQIKKASTLAKNTSISILNMSGFHGLEMAMNAGVDLAIGDFVLEFDSAVQDYDDSQIMKVYRTALEGGYDIVSASADRKQRFSSRCFYFALEHFTRTSYKMETESFRLLSRRVINRIGSMNRAVPYRKAAYANCGLKTAHVVYPVKTTEAITTFSDRQEKQYRKGLALDTLILFTDIGYLFSAGMSAFMMLTAIFMAVYSLFIYLTSHPIAGWTTTILFLSVVFFGLFGILTIIIKYLQLLIDLTFRRKRYSFESIEKITR